MTIATHSSVDAGAPIIIVDPENSEAAPVVVTVGYQPQAQRGQVYDFGPILDDMDTALNWIKAASRTTHLDVDWVVEQVQKIEGPAKFTFATVGKARIELLVRNGEIVRGRDCDVTWSTEIAVVGPEPEARVENTRRPMIEADGRLAPPMITFFLTLRGGKPRVALEKALNEKVDTIIELLSQGRAFADCIRYHTLPEGLD